MRERFGNPYISGANGYMQAISAVMTFELAVVNEVTIRYFRYSSFYNYVARNWNKH